MPLYRKSHQGQFVSFEETPFQDMEKALEDWIEANPHLLFEDEPIAIIARQPRTEFGKYADLLGIDESGACVVVELKRGDAPREVIAQALEYAAWVDSLTRSGLDDLARDYAARHGANVEGLVYVYQRAFLPQDEDEVGAVDPLDRITFNHRQRIVIIAERISREVEQTLRYLRTKLGVDITGREFRVHQAGEELILETSSIVGREATAVAAEKSPTVSGIEADDSIRLRAETDFVKRAVTSIEDWIASLNDSPLDVHHRRGSEHAIRLRGREIASYYYARRWLYCVLLNPSDTEKASLHSRLSKPEEVKEVPQGVRFHLATDADLEVLQEILLRRAAGVAPSRWTLDHWAFGAHEEVFPCLTSARSTLRSSRPKLWTWSAGATNPWPPSPRISGLPIRRCATGCGRPNPTAVRVMG